MLLYNNIYYPLLLKTCKINTFKSECSVIVICLENV